MRDFFHFREKIIFFLIALSLSLESAPVKVVLNNGLTVIVSRRESPQILSIVAVIKGGSLGEDKAGTANLLARVMPLDTKEHTKDEISDILTENLIDLEVETQENYWTFSLFAPSYSLKPALKILSEILFTPRLEEFELEREKKEVLAELENMEAKPLVQAYARLREMIYDQNPYARLISGTKEDVAKITTQDIEDMWRRFFRPDNVVLSVVGDVEAGQVVALAREVFERYPRGEGKVSLLPPPYRPLIRSYPSVMERPAALSILLIGIPLPGIDSEDYVALNVVNAILGKGHSCRLAQALRWRKGLSYDFGSLYPPILGKSHLFIWAFVDPSRIEEAKEAILEELSFLDRVDEQTVERAKRQLLGEYILSRSRLKQQGFYLAWWEAMGLGYQYEETYQASLKKINLWDIKRVVRKYFKKYYAILVVMPSS